MNYITHSDGGKTIRLPFNAKAVTQVLVDNAPVAFTWQPDTVTLAVAVGAGTSVNISYEPVYTGASGGISPEKLNSLVDDTEAAAAKDAILAKLVENYNSVTATLSSLKTKFAGEVILVANDTGIAPAGSSRASGLFVPRTAYGQNRYCLTNGLTNFTANSANKLWYVTNNVAIQYYDFGTGTTTTGTMYVSSIVPGGSVVATDDTLYMMGGENSSSGAPSASCSRYQINTNAVSSLPSLPAVRTRAATAFQADGAILVIGGLNTGTANAASATNTIFRYNVSNNTMETLAATLPFRCWLPKTTRRADGTIVIVAAAGQATDDGVNLTTTARAALFNPATGICSSLDSGGGYGAMGTLPDGRTVVMGTLTLAKALNPQAAPGSQWTDYPLTAPTGVTGVGLPIGAFCSAVKGEYLPITLSFSGGGSASGLFWTGSTPSNAGSSFYVTVNT